MRGCSISGFVFFLMSIAIASIAIAPAAQNAADLEASLIPITAPSRTGGPGVLDVRLTWKGKGLLRGRLEIAFTDVVEALGRVRTDEIVVSGDPMVIRLTVPAMATAIQGSNTRATLRFHTAKRTLDLGRHSVPIPRADRRCLVIAVASAGGRVDRPLQAVGRSVFLERYPPACGLRRRLEPGQDRTAPLVPMSSLARLDPEDLPASPLDYCAFDVVILRAEAFRLLKSKQLRALGRWVEAGGSFGLLADRLPGLASRHVDFLNRLAAGEGIEYAISPAGELTLTEPTGVVYSLHPTDPPPVGRLPARFILRLRAELGRAVIVHRPLDAQRDLDSRAWRRAVAHLWKIRREKIGEFDPRPSVSRWPRPRGGSWSADPDPVLALRDHHDPAGILLPAGLRLVPYGLFFLILGAFLLVIGPGEYALARFFRRGWLTWVLFPLVCVGFTVLMIRVARHYLGDDHRRSIVIVDVGKGGRELRRSCIEAVFLGAERSAERALLNVLVNPIDAGALTGPPGPLADTPPGNAGSIRIEGRYPGRYRARQRIRQWTPAFTRFLSLEPGATRDAIDWSRVDQAVTGRSGPIDRLRLREAIRIDPVHVELFTGQCDWDALYTRDEPAFVEAGARERGDGVVVKPLPVLVRLLHALSVRWDGFFSLAHRTSPSGSGGLEDLALVDRGDPGQRLLLIVTVDGNGNFIVYRRLYAEGRWGWGSGR